MSQIDPYESTRLSLLDVAMDKLRMGNKKGMLHRIFISTKLESQLEKKEKKSIGSKLEKFLKQCTSQLAHESSSGIMLMYNVHTLICLEASQEVIMLFLRELGAVPALSECRVLSFTENVPSRLFQHGWADVSLPTRPLEQKLETSDTISQIIVGVMQQIVKLSEYVNHNVPKVNYKARCETMISSQIQLIVPEETVEYVTADKTILPTTDYLEKYTSPVDIVLDQEIVWPVAVRLFPYM